MTKLEEMTDYLKKAKTKQVHTLSQEVDQYILIMKLKTWIEREKKYVSKRI